MRFDLKIHWKLAPTDFGEAKSECGDAPLPVALKNLPALLQQPGICLFAAFSLLMTVNMAQSPDFLVLAWKVSPDLTASTHKSGTQQRNFLWKGIGCTGMVGIKTQDGNAKCQATDGALENVSFSFGCAFLTLMSSSSSFAGSQMDAYCREGN